MSEPHIGPALINTIISRNADASAQAWCDYLHQKVHSETTVSTALAEHWQFPDLAGNKIIWLANALNERWLRIINAPHAEQLQPFTQYGWLSLEISVENVDALYPQLEDSPFKIIGKPANLDVSDDIRAMQVQGPDGEILYLTEIKAPVPPFDLPFARCPVDRLFIPVAMVPDRSSALAVYEQLARTQGMQFDTRITVINRALGLPVESRHPVATIQLAGKSLVEFDQIDGLKKVDKTTLQTGINSITFATRTIPDKLDRYAIEQGPYFDHQSVFFMDKSGLRIELMQG